MLGVPFERIDLGGAAMSKKDRQKDGDPGGARAASMVEVATDLDAELRRFEELAATARRAPLSSQKSIERAVGVIRQAAESQGRLTGHLHALLGAMGAARDRVEAAAGSLNVRADEIQERSEEHAGLMQRLASLGQEAMEIGAQAQGIGQREPREPREPREAGAGEDPDAAPGAPGPDVIEEVRAVLQRLVTLAQQADELAKATEAAGLVDLARQADSLRQTLGAARQKVTLLERSLLANGPPRA